MRRLLVAMAAVLVLAGCAEPVAPEPPETAEPTVTSQAPTPAPTPSAVPSGTPTPAPVTTVSPPETEPEPEPEPGTDQQGPPSGFDAGPASSAQVLVNKRNPLQPADYVPQLVSVSIAQDGDETVRPETDAALAGLSTAMRAAIGEGVHVFSSYRSYATQTGLYNNYVARWGQAEADTTSARPGHSEHQTGLAVDVVGTGGQCRLNTCFGDTAAGRWIAENAWQQGFIVRYPRGLEGITGYEWEPWHLRFVGVEVASAMHDQGIATYEEFLGAGHAPNYG
ncbi:D-Ala-D-Ala carboxypeptidase. Metallo peptidase. MEROPS family M15B [Agrococcus baldri]|uniref:D-Ala-D-Ala carboxypeptidase. Metallo peptidase. MEROPS family M15B n=1 Tax=Agrococcus baldri TaxID=153730 RepID=A0AA94HLQ4_9MICO|nr:M15 family metallopeptidase [Agrococcus baldri]SFS07908.1 D-Ala-D-Ala carboxypeptidase. Metallo peptidase. MEROPS family M15B [Agrococcus baldri]